VKNYPGWIGLLLAVTLACGCATVAVSPKPKELRRLEGVNALPKDARIGLTDFTVCGGSYLDKLNPDYHEQDVKATFFRSCTKLGHPRAFSRKFRQRLEVRFGRKLVSVKSDKTFKPKQVLRDAEKLGLEYVIAGDLLYLGERDNKTVVSALFYLIDVAKGKIVLVGQVKKDGPMGQVYKVIDDVADQLFVSAYEK
jgi:hypothetical protein